MKKGIFLSMLLIFATYSCGQNTNTSAAQTIEYEYEPQEDLHHVIPGDGTKSCSPYFFVKSNHPSRTALSLQSTKADVKIAGSIANVTIEQVYVNTGQRIYDAIYIFPGSTRAAVYGLDMTIGKRVIHAQVKEREKARTEFEEARKEGKRATLLEQDRPNVFKMEVANIRPGDTIKVNMFYTELLEYRDREYEFVYPTAVGPRYSNQEEELATRSIIQTFFMEKPAFDVDVTIESPVPVQNVAASHQIKMSRISDKLMKITLNDPKGTETGADFILKYGLQGGTVESGLTLYNHGNEKFFLMMMQPPKKAAETAIMPREYIFIVDVSGSMSGFPLEISKTILRKLISSLKPADRFNVLLFESNNAMMSDRSLPATQENIDKATRLISNQYGSGGTELYPALKKAFSYKDPELEDYARTFIIATDGYVTIESKAFQLIADNVDKANFIPLGIGSSVNRYLIEGMAYAGASEAFIIENKTEAEKVGEHLIKTISQPLLSDISINWGGMEVYDTYPQKIPNMFTERPIVVFGKYKGNPKGTITLSGKTAQGYFQRSIPTKEIVHSKNEALRYLWARNKIKFLSDYAFCFVSGSDGWGGHEGISEKSKQEVTRLGLKYNLLTAYTSFLAIDNDLQGGEYHQPELKATVKYTPTAITTNMEGRTESCAVIADCSPVLAAAPAPAEMAFTHVESMPMYSGGEKEVMKYLAENLKYPIAAIEAGIQGTVVLRFIIDKNGDVTDITVLRSLEPSCDAEAIRVLKSMPRWIPGRQNGNPVAAYFTLPVRFKLIENIPITLDNTK
ncbi:MAG: TonB family protein [Dysgonamonadaceae bacterium]|jgi:Ca-activated chloride channel family protein|nr:TonB family protein [Dysgonamonadaceae bacterium]